MELTAIETCESEVCHPLGLMSQLLSNCDSTWAEEGLTITISERIWKELLEQPKGQVEWKLCDLRHQIGSVVDEEQLECKVFRRLLKGLNPQLQLVYLTWLEGLIWGVQPRLSGGLELQALQELETAVEELKLLLKGIEGELERHVLQLLVKWLSVYLSEEGDRRGGFRNLLLDGWSLEFCKIILLAAGDVEKNPGPTLTDEQLKNIDGTILVTDDLLKVFNAVYNCRSKWHNLCVMLGISDDDLSAIKKEQANDPGACLREGFARWLKGGNNTSWRILAGAVATPSGGDDHALAMAIAEEHKAIPVVTAHAKPCIDCERSEQMSSELNNMCRSIVRLLRVDVDKIKDSLCYLTDPQCPDFNQLCVPQEVYEDATSMKELFSRLCPKYINPKKIFVLREIVRNHGTQQCKRLLRKYTDRFYN